jgi:hypothetical protein
MDKFLTLCSVCGELIDQSTGLCTNPNCPGHTKTSSSQETIG